MKFANKNVKNLYDYLCSEREKINNHALISFRDNVLTPTELREVTALRVKLEIINKSIDILLGN